MKLLLLFSLLISPALYQEITAQAFAVGHTTITFVDATRNNRNINTEIYYPSDVAGDNVALTAISDDFPVLSFGHGFVMTVDAYENIWSNVVPKGYIMAFPKTEGGILPSHLEYARDLAFVIDALTLESQNPVSLFYNRVSSMSAVMGHSMGGGAAILAAALEPAIDAIAVLAPAETNPSAIGAAGSLSIQALIIAGGNDCVTPPAGNQIPIYEALTSACKIYISITGGSHCQMAETNFLCSFGEITCTSAPDITRDQQHAVISNYLGDWLDSTLKADCAAGTSFDEQVAADSVISFDKTCNLCEPLATAEFERSGITVYPNPFSDHITVDINSAQPTDFTLFDFTMRKIVMATFLQNVKVNLEQFSSGLYFYTIQRSGKTVTSGKLLKK